MNGWMVVMLEHATQGKEDVLCFLSEPQKMMPGAVGQLARKVGVGKLPDSARPK